MTRQTTYNITDRITIGSVYLFLTEGLEGAKKITILLTVGLLQGRPIPIRNIYQIRTLDSFLKRKWHGFFSGNRWQSENLQVQIADETEE